MVLAHAVALLVYVVVRAFKRGVRNAPIRDEGRQLAVLTPSPLMRYGEPRVFLRPPAKPHELLVTNMLAVMLRGS